MADRFLFDFFCERDVDDQAIIVRKLFAGANVPQSLDENTAAVIFDRCAVRIAGMIDPLRFISANTGIDHSLFVIKTEIVSAWIIEIFRNVRPQNPAASVFDDERAFPDRPGRKNAATVDRRFLDLQELRRAVAGIPGARPRSLFPSLSGHFSSNAEN